MTLVFLDLETTGLNPRRHEVMQIAAVAVDHDLRVVEEFEVKVHVTGRNVPRGMLRRTRYDPDVWRRDAISPKYAAFRLARFLRRHSTRASMGSRGSSRVAQLVAHNAAFDGPFLEAWSRRQRVHMPITFRALCTIQRAEWHFVEASLPRPASMHDDLWSQAVSISSAEELAGPSGMLAWMTARLPTWAPIARVFQPED